MNLWTRSTIKYLSDKYGFKLNKSLGQNFLTDLWPVEALIEGSGISAGDLVIEIGPGLGTLTAEAAKVAAHVTSIEIDENLKPLLEETLADHDNIDIVYSSVLDIDLSELIKDRRKKYGIEGRTRIIGNLPYYITTPIVFKLIEEDTKASNVTIMTQKEVADRMRALPGGKEYGGLSIMVQYHCTVEQVTMVSAEVFYPRPKVDSCIINLEFMDKKAAEVEDEKIFYQVVKAGFGQRRKTLLNALSAGLGKPKDEINKILEASNIDSRRRAETLSIEEFATVANEVVKGK